MILFSDKKNCCGCGACMNYCPQNAIFMNCDEKGFLYPMINNELCVECGGCEQVCAYQDKNRRRSLKETYAAVTCNTDVRESASGGVFASFAQEILHGGGVVYGCAMLYENGILQPKHICVTNIEDLILLKGSKYVQSEIGYIYRDVRKRLKKGVTVLFSGTPCQIAGLHGYLQKNYDNLYTLDIICHGVPSTQLFQDYLRHIEKKANQKIIGFRFRDKQLGWKLFGSLTCKNSDGSVVQSFFEPEKSSYYQMFLNSYTYRENCYSCPYACDNRQGDITIGDFWCIDLVHPEMLTQNGGDFEEQQGISCMIINNQHGQEMFQKYGTGISVQRSSYEYAAKYNGQLNHPSTLKKERKKVLDIYKTKGYGAVEKWYCRRMIPIKIKRIISDFTPQFLKDITRPVRRKRS